MISTSLLSLVATAISTVSALPLAQQAQVAVADVAARSPGFLSFPISRTNKAQTGETKISSISQADSVTLQNQVSYYSCNISIGTPAQEFTVLLDTGSSDLWVLSPQSGQSPSFSENKSSTFESLNETFSISYLSGDAQGDWATDVVTVGDAPIRSQQFATVNTNNAGQGIMGIGLNATESTNDKYSNVPQSLKTQGYIYANAYSLYLDDRQSNTGTVLFGGVDSTKYTGNLYTVPLTSTSSLTIKSTGVFVTDNNGSNSTASSSSFDTLLDSGTTFSYIPQSVADSIAKALNATYSDKQGAYFTDNYSDDVAVTYSFSGAQVTVPASELFIDGSLYNGSGAPGKYQLTIARANPSNNMVILGDSFLRSAYVVYDLDNMQISLAQSNFNAGAGTGIVQIITSQVPGALPAPGA